MKDDDATRAQLEVTADVLRTRLIHDVDELAHAPVIETVRHARRTARKVAPIALGVLVGLTALALFLAVRGVVRAFTPDR